MEAADSGIAGGRHLCGGGVGNAALHGSERAGGKRTLADKSRIKHTGSVRRILLLLTFLAIPLGGCEPLRGVVSKKESLGSVNVPCVDAALRKTFGKVERWDYVGDGNGFPKGTKVAQLAYYQSDDGQGWAKLEIGEVTSGTRLAHSFTGIGAEIPERDFPPALRAMERARAALQAACKLDLGGMQLKSVGQHVEAVGRATPNGG